MDTWRLNTDVKCSKLRTFSNLFLQKPFFPDENTFDWEKNEQLINEYIGQKQINMTWHGMTTMTDLHQSTILVYPKLMTLDRFCLCEEKTRQGQRRNVRTRTTISQSAVTWMSYPLNHVFFWSIVKFLVINVNVW